MVLSDGKCAVATEDRPHACDPTEAQECAAQCDKGDAQSCYHLAYRVLEGRDVPKDPALATRLFEKACSGGVAMGCYERAQEHMAERLQAKDDDARMKARLAAEALYTRACELGDGWACWSISDWYLREGASAVFPRDPARAMALVRRSCNLGHAPGCATLARHMLEGEHTARDVPGAVALLQRACDGGKWQQCEAIGDLYRDGQGVLENPVLAIAAYERACDQGGRRACHSAGVLYAKGEGVPEDLARARSLYEKGCPEKGAAGWDACKSLGEALEMGLGGPKDPALAAEVYERGCMMGGCLRAGQMWENGEGVQANPERALAAYEKGCRQSSMDTAVCVAQGKLLEKKDRELAKAFYADHCARMRERWSCDEARRLGATDLPEPIKRSPATKR
jgi:TPR repeat protein